jgi:hypothetical protein
MQEYIKYFSGLKRNYGVCKTTEGFVDGETGKKGIHTNGPQYLLLNKII